MSDWIYISHPDAGSTRIPNQPGVLATYEARGWVEEPNPETGETADIFVPPKVVEKNEEDGWVTLYHRETHAEHSFPSHPDAIKGAYDAGWQGSPPKVSEPDTAEAVDDSESEGDASPAKPSKRTRKTANEDPADADPAIDEGE
jgi:hypothetical protein